MKIKNGNCVRIESVKKQPLISSYIFKFQFVKCFRMTGAKVGFLTNFTKSLIVQNWFNLDIKRKKTTFAPHFNLDE